MKLIYNINKWSLIITIFLYITIYYGLLAQIALGIIQLISAIILYYSWAHLNDKSKKHLIQYTIIVFIYAIPFFIIYNKVPSFIGLTIVYVIIPLLIAFYFLYITSLTSKNVDK